MEVVPKPLQVRYSRSIISSQPLNLAGNQRHLPRGSSQRPLLAALRAGPQRSRGGHSCELPYITAEGHLPARTATHGQPRHRAQRGRTQRLGKRHFSGSRPPFAMMYIRPVDLHTLKEASCIIVVRRVNRIGKGTSHTSHPLPLPSRKKTPKFLYPTDGHQILTFRSLWTMPFRWQWLTLSRICCIQWLQRYKGRMEGRTF